MSYKDTIKEIVEVADIVTVHVPASDENHYLFDESLFNSFKEGSVFINCARGSIVNTRALVKLLIKVL